MPRLQNNEYAIKIGLVIRAERKKIKMSQSVLAANLDITFQQLQKYEKGKGKISIDRFLQICKFLNLNAAHIICIIL